MGRLKSYFAILTALLFIPIAALQTSAQPPTRPIERHVLRSLRQIHSAQATYQSTVGDGTFGSLAHLFQAGLIDESLASGAKYGYLYALSTTTVPAGFAVSARPRAYRKTGVRSFLIDATGDIRGGDRNGGPATPDDPVIDDCTSGSIEENERCTITDLRWLTGAQATFAATLGKGNYGTLTELYSAGLVRADLSDHSARGYLYEVEVIAHVPGELPAAFKIRATPQIYRSTAIRSFFLDQTGVIRGGDKNGGHANETDPPIN
jgi:hypothetical protein